MPAKRQSFLDKLEKELPEQPKAAPVAGPAMHEDKPRARPDIAKSTIYLPSAVHDRLREIAFTERCKVHDLIMEGIDRMLESRGHPERARDRKVA